MSACLQVPDLLHQPLAGATFTCPLQLPFAPASSICPFLLPTQQQQGLLSVCDCPLLQLCKGWSPPGLVYQVGAPLPRPPDRS